MAVMGAFCASAMTYLASEQMRSQRMGLRLYGMADEPICLSSNGSSTCRSCCSRRISVAMRHALWQIEDRTFRIRLSSLRG